MTSLPHLIDGQLIASRQAGQNVHNPATGECIAQVPFANQQEVNQAVVAAKQAFCQWSGSSLTQRTRILFQFRQLLEQKLADLANLVCQEHGKTLAEAQGSVRRGIELVEFACGLPRLLQGQYSTQVTRDTDCYSLRQAIGVSVAITPFNFPVMIPLWLVIPAIACGNTVILKPSEQDPSASLLLAGLLLEAGLPPGVCNVLHGDKSTVEALITHPQVDMVSAVGSTHAASAIYQTAIAHGKRAHTFGGAKNHAIVMPDANIAQASEAIVQAAFGCAGERCMAISVAVVVGDDTATEFVRAVQTKTQQLRVGAGHRQQTDVGPLISQAHKEKVLALIDQGVTEGAELVVDGRNVVISGYERGFYVGPCVFDRVHADMTIYQQEIFGPVLCIVRVDDAPAALDLINQNPYGNGTAIFTQSGGAAQQFVQQVQVGMVGVNVPVPVPAPYHAFGGWKASHFGDVGLQSDQLVQFYTRTKSVTAKWP
jgi:malonate-semialdehyde dehydrogenase (acetylating) / methylmalonate-semialdehyde dehydrogenase